MGKIFEIFGFLCFIGILFGVIGQCSYSKKDPVKECPVYKDKGCAHVDGMLCDYPDCSMVKEYNKKHLKVN